MVSEKEREGGPLRSDSGLNLATLENVNLPNKHTRPRSPGCQVVLTSDAGGLGSFGPRQLPPLKPAPWARADPAITDSARALDLFCRLKALLTTPTGNF